LGVWWGLKKGRAFKKRRFVLKRGEEGEKKRGRVPPEKKAPGGKKERSLLRSPLVIG